MNSDFLNTVAPPANDEARRALQVPHKDITRALKVPQQDIDTALANTQGYIMVGHGRDHVWHALIRFRAGADPEDLRATLQDIVTAPAVTPTTDLVDRDKRNDNELIVSALGFTWRGYQRMGFTDCADKFSLEFQQGFATRSQDVTGRGFEDWDREQWDPNNGYHALLILAAGRRVNGKPLPKGWDESRQREISNHFASVADVVWLKGEIPRNKAGRKIGKTLAQKPTEPFGFTDGVSQPELLTYPRPDGQVETFATPFLKSRWVRGAAPNLVLIKEPISDSHDQMEFGSYMAFLKIEQHVDLFAIAARGLAKKLNISDDRAKALIIGRNQDGSPLVHEGVDENDFADKTDSTGAKWSFACHTRKMNSRQPGQEHHRIVRRGVTYTDGKLKGIYFQCFQANLQEQFEFLFKRWANFRSQPQKGCGVDPLVGLDPNHPQQWPKPGTPAGAPPETTGFTISELTTIRGGEYFYFPSIPFLKAIQDRWKACNNAARQ
jgi:deferrochelatase/peroxidase EfeB